MIKTLIAAVAVAFCCLQAAQAQTEFPSTLAGHALIPAQTFLPAPDDAPVDLAVFETEVDGKPARSPDHPAITTPAAPNLAMDFTVRRSRGYEGMAASKDGSKLYALLEGAMWDATTKDTEKIDGREYLRILEFDVVGQRWTGRHWKYMLEANGLAIGDFNMIDETTALVIERDNGEGTPDKACVCAAARATVVASPVSRRSGARATDLSQTTHPPAASAPGQRARRQLQNASPAPGTHHARGFG